MVLHLLSPLRLLLLMIKLVEGEDHVALLLSSTTRYDQFSPIIIILMLVVVGRRRRHFGPQPPGMKIDVAGAVTMHNGRHVITSTMCCIKKYSELPQQQQIMEGRRRHHRVR